MICWTVLFSLRAMRRISALMTGSVIAAASSRSASDGKAATPIQAVMRVDEMLEAGDLEGRAVWLRMAPIFPMISARRVRGARFARGCL